MSSRLRLLPGGDVVAVRVLELEAAAARERQDRLHDRRTRFLGALEAGFPIVDMKHQQRTAGPRRPVGGEAAAEAVVHEAGVGGTVIGETPAEHGGVERLALGQIADRELAILYLRNANRVKVDSTGRPQP